MPHALDPKRKRVRRIASKPMVMFWSTKKSNQYPSWGIWQTVESGQSTRSWCNRRKNQFRDSWIWGNSYQDWSFSRKRSLHNLTGDKSTWWPRWATNWCWISLSATALISITVARSIYSQLKRAMRTLLLEIDILMESCEGYKLWRRYSREILAYLPPKKKLRLLNSHNASLGLKRIEGLMRHRDSDQTSK